MPRATASDFAGRYGPWALVTGAARGLGAAFADVLARRGLSLLLLDRDRESLEERVESLRARGARTEPIHCDLADAGFLARLDGVVGDREVGLLVNNAAVSRVGAFFERPLDELLEAQRVNCDAPLILSHHFGRRMLERGRGGIVIVSSLSALTGMPRLSQYGASKAFGTVLADGLWSELSGRGVDVVSVLGPTMDTPGYRETHPSLRLPFEPAERVAEATLDGLGRHSRVAVGFQGHVLGGLARLLPRDVLLKMLAGMARRMYPTG